MHSAGLPAGRGPGQDHRQAAQVQVAPGGYAESRLPVPPTGPVLAHRDRDPGSEFKLAAMGAHASDRDSSAIGIAAHNGIGAPRGIGTEQRRATQATPPNKPPNVGEAAALLFCALGQAHTLSHACVREPLEAQVAGRAADGHAGFHALRSAICTSTIPVPVPSAAT